MRVVFCFCFYLPRHSLPQELIKRCVEQFVRPQIYCFVAEVDEHVEAFEEVVAYDAVYVLHVAHSALCGGECASHLRQNVLANGYLVEEHVFQFAAASVGACYANGTSCLYSNGRATRLLSVLRLSFFE